MSRHAPTVSHETLEDSRFLSTHPRLLLPDQISRSPGRNVPIIPSLEHIAESTNQELLHSVAPREHTPCGWHDPSKLKSLLTPFLVDLARSSGQNSLASCLCPPRKPSTSVSRVASSCSDTVSAPTSVRKVCPLMLLSFFQCRHHYPACHPSHHHPSPPQRPDKHSTTCYSHVFHAKSYRDRWLHVSLGVAEP